MIARARAAALGAVAAGAVAAAAVAAGAAGTTAAGTATTAAAAAELFPRGLAPVDTGGGPGPSARACAGCHADAHADWTASRHGQAWRNAIFQREYRDRPLEWCVHCHAPLRAQLDEVRAGGGGALADEGITCVACHVRGGRMLSRRRAPGSPHDTDARADFGGPGFCAGCHQFNFPIIEADPTGRGPGRVTGYGPHPMQDTARQHAAGPRRATPCLECHRAGDGGHRFPGGHDAAMLARAVTVEACRTGRGGELEVRLTNTGAGHNVPTGDLHRHLVLRAWRAAAPEALAEMVLGRRFEADEAGGGKRTIADTTLRAGEARTVRLTVPRAASPARERDPISLELRLVYTIDEFPFRGRELAEPTWATMVARELRWAPLTGVAPRSCLPALTKAAAYWPRAAQASVVKHE